MGTCCVWRADTAEPAKFGLPWLVSGVPWHEAAAVFEMRLFTYTEPSAFTSGRFFLLRRTLLVGVW